MKSVFFMFLLVSNLFGEMMIYERIGDLPETAEIYRFKGEESVFVDASSIPTEYRSRFKNTDVFEKVDMSEVKKANKKSADGIVVYDNVEFSRNDSDLFKLGNNNFIDFFTVPENKKATLATKLEKFDHIGVAKQRLEERKKEIETKIDNVLKNIGFVELKETTGNSNVDEKLLKYKEIMAKYKGKVIEELDDQIKKSAGRGLLDEVTSVTDMKEKFIADANSLTEEMVKDFYSVKRAFQSYVSNKEKEGERLVKVIDLEVTKETKNGNISVAQALNELKGKYATVEEGVTKEKVSYGKSNYAVISISSNYTTETKQLIGNETRFTDRLTTISYVDDSLVKDKIVFLITPSSHTTASKDPLVINIKVLEKGTIIFFGDINNSNELNIKMFKATNAKIKGSYISAYYELNAKKGDTFSITITEGHLACKGIIIE